MAEIFFFISLSWIIFLLGYFILRDFTTTVMGSLLIMSIGVYGSIYGVYGINNPINTSFSLIHLGLGLYWIIKSSIKLSNDPVSKIFDLSKSFSRRSKDGLSKETTSKGRTVRRA